MNAMKGETPLVVGEGDARREFTLVLDHEALISAEAAYRKPMAQMMAEASLGFVGAMRALLFGALRTHHPEVTLREASAILLEHGEVVGPALEAATRAAFPKATEDAHAEGKKAVDPRASARAGTSSGRSGAKRGSTPKASSKPRRGSSRSSSERG